MPLQLAQQGGEGVMALVAAVLMLFFMFMVLAPFGYFLWVWQQGVRGGAYVPIITLVGMKLRRVPPGKIVKGLVFLRRHGVAEVTVEDLEAHYLAGGNIKRSCQAMAMAREHELAAAWQAVAAVDLAGQDPIAAVQTNTGIDGGPLAVGD